MSNNNEQHLTRRRFLETLSAVSAGMACTAGSPAEAKPSTMRYRKLGRTGLMISEIGLGCGVVSQQLGQERFDRYREELPAITRKLLECGGNFVTTANYFNSEEILGRALQGRRKEAYLFIGTRGNVKTVMANCERTLKRFNTDVIDGYFRHGGWDEEFLAASEKLKQQGKIRFIGMSAHVPEMHRLRIEAGVVDFILQPYNYMNLAKWTEKTDGTSTVELFTLCKKKNVGVIVIKPMTGHFIPNWAKDTKDEKVVRLLNELKEFGKKNLYQAFLMWVLRNANVSCAAVGMTTVQEVIEDCEAVARQLSERHLSLLEQYAAAATSDYCRLCETCQPSCPVGVRIADILRFRMYYKNYGNHEDARAFYASLDASQQAAACTACGACEQACPNKLAIRDKLSEAHRLLG